MKLFYSTTSPFARKAHMFLHYTGLIQHTELIVTTFTSDELRQLNPLGKIPAFIDNDLTLLDSSLICEYLDHKYTASGKPSLFHRGQDDYFPIQKAHILANGILEASVSTVMEQRRETEPSSHWLERWHTAVTKSLETIEIDQLGTKENVNIATIATISALGYLDFRLDGLQWRDVNPALSDWQSSFEQCPWLIETLPKE